MKKYIGYIPLVIITLLMSYCIYTVMTTDLVFSYEHYIGIAGIALSIIAVFIKPMVSKLITGAVLLLGTFSFASFTAIIEYHKIGFSVEGKGLDIKIQLYSSLLLLLFILLNFDFIKSLFKQKSKAN